MTRNHRRTLLITVASAGLAGCASTAPSAPALPPAPAATTVQLAEQVKAAERAFSASMGKRDLNAFAALIAEDAVFINGGSPLRGKAAILAFWGRFFTAPTAPFSWEPVIAEVSGNGTLGYAQARMFHRDRRFAGIRPLKTRGFNPMQCVRSQTAQHPPHP